MQGLRRQTMPLPTIDKIMRPLALLVYYIRNDGEVVADVIELTRSETKEEKVREML